MIIPGGEREYVTGQQTEDRCPVASLAFLLVATMGPWFADSHPATEETCRPPLVWLGDGRCACLVPLLGFVEYAITSQNPMWLLGLPPALPVLSTLLLLLIGERRWLWICHLAAWGLVAIYSLFFFIVGNMFTWGDGLGVVVAVAILAGETTLTSPPWIRNGNDHEKNNCWYDHVFGRLYQ